MIKIRSLTKVYKSQNAEKPALNNLSLEISQGEFVAIIGPSESGKSTLLNILGLLDSPTEGFYQFGKQDVSRISDRERAEIRKCFVGHVFPDFNLVDELTVFENVELPLLYLDVKASDRKPKVADILELMHIGHRRNAFPQYLSPELQRSVAVARAIVTKPKLFLLDERPGNPGLNRDEELMKTLLQLNEDGVTIAMVTQSPYEANYAHRIIHLFGGQVVTENNSENFSL